MTCPDDLQLAAFLEARLPREDHARLLAHIADCAACAEIVAETRRFLEPQEAGIVVPLRPAAVPGQGWRTKPLRWATGIAATLLIAAILIVVRFRAEPIGPAGKMAQRVVAAERQGTASAAGWNEWPNARGFSGSSPEIHHFRWGVVTVDVELVAARRDRGALESMLHELEGWSAGADTAALPVLLALRRGSPRESLAAVRKLERSLEASADIDSASAYRLGRWIEALRLGAVSGDEAAVRALAAERPSPPPLADASRASETLRRIDRVLGEPTPDLRVLQALCAELIRLR